MKLAKNLSLLPCLLLDNRGTPWITLDDMRLIKKTFGITQNQMRYLEGESKRLGIGIGEVIRRVLDEYIVELNQMTRASSKTKPGPSARSNRARSHSSGSLK